MRLVLRFLGKITALLGAVAVIAAFGALATSEPAGSRLLHFVWMLLVGIVLLAIGSLLMRKNKVQT